MKTIDYIRRIFRYLPIHHYTKLGGSENAIGTKIVDNATLILANSDTSYLKQEIKDDDVVIDSTNGYVDTPEAFEMDGINSETCIYGTHILDFYEPNVLTKIICDFDLAYNEIFNTDNSKLITMDITRIISGHTLNVIGQTAFIDIHKTDSVKATRTDAITHNNIKLTGIRYRLISEYCDIREDATFNTEIDKIANMSLDDFLYIKY